MYTKLNASRSYVYAVARACDAGKVSRRVRRLALSPRRQLDRIRLTMRPDRIALAPFCIRLIGQWRSR